jgi:hypothetical protein
MEHSRLVTFARPARVAAGKDGILSFTYTKRAETGADGVCRIEVSRKRAHPPRLLDFVNLANAPDEAIVKMAGKHGPLFDESLDRPREFAESLDNWRFFARLAGCLLDEGRALCLGKHAGDADRGRVLARWVQANIEGTFPGSDSTTRARQFRLQVALDRWFKTGGYDVKSNWTGNSIRVSVVPATLFCAIGLMIADEIRASRVQQQRCFECGVWFKPTRLLPGHRQFCKKCGRRAAMKYVMRDRRTKQAELQ